jgi:hypothetical protein
MEEVFGTFKSGLQAVRGQRDVLLILARFRYRGYNAVTSRDFSEHLLEKLLLPIFREDSEVQGLHSLLIVRKHKSLEVGALSDFEEFALQRLSAEVPESTRVPADGFRRLEITPFLTKQLEHHLDEFTEFIESDGMEGARKIIRNLVQSDSWRPNELNVMLGPVEALTKLPGRP